jgi:tRNA A-37 threonylcarbamoyl transferase component Bud32
VTNPTGAAAENALTVKVIRQGGWFKADIKRLSFGGEDAILKDFSGKSWPVRLLGRRQVAQEVRALRRLQGIPGIPHCYGEAERGAAVLMERMDGDWITRFCDARPADAPAVFDRLERLLAAIHARGVAHIDLRKRDNILVQVDGSPCIIDFNASFCFEPATLGARLLFPLLRRIDDSAVLKWKSRLAPGLMSPEDWKRHRRMSLLRKLWIFN